MIRRSASTQTPAKKSGRRESEISTRAKASPWRLSSPKVKCSLGSADLVWLHYWATLLSGAAVRGRPAPHAATRRATAPTARSLLRLWLALALPRPGLPGARDQRATLLGAHDAARDTHADLCAAADSQPACCTGVVCAARTLACSG